VSAVSASSAGPSGSSGGGDEEAQRDSALVDAEAKRGMETGEARFSFEVPG
jgi:hypothetical protein